MKTLIIVLLFAFSITAAEAQTIPNAQEVASIEFQSDGSPFKILGRAMLSHNHKTTVMQRLFVVCTSPADETYRREERSIAGVFTRLNLLHTVWLIESEPPVGSIHCALLSSFTPHVAEENANAGNPRIEIVP